MVDDADRSAGSLPEDLDGPAVGQQLVMGRLERPAQQRQPGGVDAERVPVCGLHQRIGQCRPGVDPVAEGVRRQCHVVGEGVGGFPGQPAAALHDLQRHVPVVQPDERRDPVLEQAVDHPVVERQSRRIGRPGPFRLDPRPGQRHPRGADAELGEQGEVSFPAVVVVDRDVRGAAVGDAPGKRAEHVPHRRRPPADCGRPLQLVGRTGRAEDESFGQGRRRHRSG